MNDFDFAHFMTTYVEFHTEEPPGGEYIPMTEEEAQARFMEFIAAIWDEGFDEGHYVEGERRTCDCRKNPYRKADV